MITTNSEKNIQKNFLKFEIIDDILYTVNPCFCKNVTNIVWSYLRPYCEVCEKCCIACCYYCALFGCLSCGYCCSDDWILFNKKKKQKTMFV